MDCKCLECDCNVIHDTVVNNTLKAMPSGMVIEKIASFFKVIGDNTRARILFALDSNEMCVCDIANVLNMTKSAVSHQLSVLRDERIVKCNRVGKEVYYSLDDGHVKEVYEVALSHVKEILDEKV
ncbi:MAG: metalloregulator ArsR/SmtB family transcription factor [Clostridium sp.]|nr:MAG: metalloregulator ArsR/SmtB family transcription factor [Clostridium sp.]